MADKFVKISSGEIVNVTQERIKRDSAREKRALINADISPNDKQNRSLRIGYGAVTKSFGIIIAVMLLVAMYRVSVGGKVPLFGDLLNLISSSPNLQLPMLGTLFVDWIATVDFGFMTFIKPIFSLLGTAIDFLMFIVNGYIAVYSYIWFFIQWIFAV